LLLTPLLGDLGVSFPVRTRTEPQKLIFVRLGVSEIVSFVYNTLFILTDGLSDFAFVLGMTDGMIRLRCGTQAVFEKTCPTTQKT